MSNRIDEPTRERVREVIAEVQALKLPPDEFWQMVEERLGVEHDDALEALVEDPLIFGISGLGMLPHRAKKK